MLFRSTDEIITSAKLNARLKQVTVEKKLHLVFHLKLGRLPVEGRFLTHIIQYTEDAGTHFRLQFTERIDALNAFI